MTNPLVRAWRWWFAIPVSVRFAIGIWLALLIGVTVRATVQGVTAQSVVPIYLAAGERWLRSELLYPTDTGMDLYRNPPGVAALFAPFTFLSPKLAAITWRLLSIAVYLYGVRNLTRDLLPPLTPWRAAVVWMSAAVLVLPAFNNGQVNLMIVAAALCGTAAAARGRWWASAAWLAFAGWLKVYPLAVGLLCVVAAPRQLGWRLAVMCAVLFAAPFALQNPAYVWDRHLEFVDEMKRDDRTVSHVTITRAPKDWTILPRVWFDVAVPRAAVQAVALLAAAGMSLFVFCRREPQGSANDRPRSPAARGYLLALILGLIWLTLFGPATEMNTYSMLAPVAGVLAVWPGRVRTWVRVAAWVGCALLVAAIIRASFPSQADFKLVEAQPIGAALLLVAAVQIGLPRGGDERSN